jgi:two-component system, NarL family, response regulator DevR
MSESIGITVFLLTENKLLGEALARILQKRTDIQVAGNAAFSASALERLAAGKPDVVVLDSRRSALPGPGLCTQVARVCPNAKLVLVGMDDDESAFLAAVREGIVGYVLKDASAAEIVGTVRAVAKGEAVCPPSLSVALFRSAARQTGFAYSPEFQSEFGLSAREQKLVGLIRLGLSNKEIGARLSLSEQTVKNHIHRILRKVGATDRYQILERCQLAWEGSVSLASPTPEFLDVRARDGRPGRAD